MVAYLWWLVVLWRMGISNSGCSVFLSSKISIVTTPRLEDKDSGTKSQKCAQYKLYPTELTVREVVMVKLQWEHTSDWRTNTQDPGMHRSPDWAITCSPKSHWCVSWKLKVNGDVTCDDAFVSSQEWDGHFALAWGCVKPVPWHNLDSAIYK
jgi:hypothetical protein